MNDENELHETVNLINMIESGQYYNKIQDVRPFSKDNGFDHIFDDESNCGKDNDNSPSKYDNIFDDEDTIFSSTDNDNTPSQYDDIFDETVQEPHPTNQSMPMPSQIGSEIGINMTKYLSQEQDYAQTQTNFTAFEKHFKDAKVNLCKSMENSKKSGANIGHMIFNKAERRHSMGYIDVLKSRKRLLDSFTKFEARPISRRISIGF